MASNHLKTSPTQTPSELVKREVRKIHPTAASPEHGPDVYEIDVVTYEQVDECRMRSFQFCPTHGPTSVK